MCHSVLVLFSVVATMQYDWKKNGSYLEEIVYTTTNNLCIYIRKKKKLQFTYLAKNTCGFL